MKTVLTMMRHGESEWNKENLFTGWVDVPLSSRGIEEAIEGGKKIAHYPIDLVFTSSLVRAQMTAVLALLQHHSGKVPRFLHEGNDAIARWSEMCDERALAKTIPVRCAWQLNERMYGALQGLNKAETAAKYGKEQVQIWRRSYDVAPPEGESLKMTAERTIPFFEQEIVSALNQGKNVFIAAHGNSLRSICMLLDGLSPDEVVRLELGTGVPLIYQFENGVFKKEQAEVRSTHERM